MALSSDEIIKRQIITEVGHTIGKIRLRIFPESSNEDQVPFSEGGLTFGYQGIHYGSCDAAWFIPNQTYIDGYNNKKTDNLPVIALEGTDALQRGSSGNAQYQRFHHALGAVKNGLIGIYYLRHGKDVIQPDLYGMAYNASITEKGYYLILQDLNVVKDLLILIDKYGVNSEKVKSLIDLILNDMKQKYDESFKQRYNDDWRKFAKKRSTIFLKDDIVVKHAGRNELNFTDSSQRAGHIAVGEMYLTKYFFPDKKFYYLFPRMTQANIDYLNKHKKSDKEWSLIQKEPNVYVKTMDNLIGLPMEIREELLDLQDKPLKGTFISRYNTAVKRIVKMINSEEITIS